MHLLKITDKSINSSYEQHCGASWGKDYFKKSAKQDVKLWVNYVYKHVKICR